MSNMPTNATQEPKKTPGAPGKDPVHNPDPNRIPGVHPDSSPTSPENPSQYPVRHPDEVPVQEPNEVPFEGDMPSQEIPQTLQ